MTRRALLDATGAAPETPLRVLLRDACQSVDHARTDERTDPAALGGGWSLLDSFSSNGRRYVVAARNTVSNQRPDLSPREAQVVGLLALGHSNKVISYELGLAWSTVRVLVHRAARKLGVGTRKELERAAVPLLVRSSGRRAAEPCTGNCAGSTANDGRPPSFVVGTSSVLQIPKAGAPSFAPAVEPFPRIGS